jgi:hypothetical protein
VDGLDTGLVCVSEALTGLFLQHRLYDLAPREQNRAGLASIQLFSDRILGVPVRLIHTAPAAGDGMGNGLSDRNTWSA